MEMDKLLRLPCVRLATGGKEEVGIDSSSSVSRRISLIFSLDNERYV